MLRGRRPRGLLRQPCLSRCFASTLLPTQSIYISRSTNPYFNLSLEDWLFRHKSPKEPLLLLYRDAPCVVIGRNQNPWKEVNLPSLQRKGVPFVRRRSGGGTVYHDLGNTNYSIHLPRSSFDRNETSQVVLRAVRSLGIDARINDRNDICVSGSAYKIVNNRAYHHGTMLISTRLDTLGDLLRTNKETMIAKGVASVRSPVSNLAQFNTAATHDSFVDSAVRAFRAEYGIAEAERPVMVEENDQSVSIPHIADGMAELRTWEWAYGQTPEFTYTLEHAFTWGTVTSSITSKYGIINDCMFTLEISDIDADPSLRHEEEDLQLLAAALKGRKYGFVEDLALAALPPDRRYRIRDAVWAEMKHAMTH